MNDAELQHLLVLDAAHGPALAIDAADADAIVDAALVGAGFGPGGGGGAGGRSARGGSGGSTGSPGGAASTLTKFKLALLVGGAAVLAIAIVLVLWRSRGGGSERVAAVIPDAAVDASAGSGAGEPAATEEAPRPDAAIAEPPTIEMTDDSLADEPKRNEAPAPRERAKPQPPTKPADTETPDDLLAAANAKRAAKEWRASDALYARVVERAPKSLAAQTALVASGSLRLEHLGDPNGAAQRFRRALVLAPRGALAEDARWGLVEAARANRNVAAEQSALDDFLANHPTSPLAARAKARRAELK